MGKTNIIQGDCFELIKELPDNSVDLVITSPPYADIISSYGTDISIKKPTEYVDWILPLFNEIYRVLKPSGSFILNINHNVNRGVVNPFVYELIYRSQKETKLKLYADYYWWKKNGIPNGSKKRFRNFTEFIFHFVKDPKQLKFYMDRVLEEPAESYIKSPMNNHGDVKEGTRVRQKVRFMKNITDGKQDHVYQYRLLPDKIRPDNVFRFPTASADRTNTIRHPAPFHRELPEYFITFLTDEDDVVLDVFSGIGTTGLPCKDLNRNYIGFELNPKYVDFSIKRLDEN